MQVHFSLIFVRETIFKFFRVAGIRVRYHTKTVFPANMFQILTLSELNADLFIRSKERVISFCVMRLFGLCTHQNIIVFVITNRMLDLDLLLLNDILYLFESFNIDSLKLLVIFVN